MVKVTRAIIAAAGLNSRMYPFTKEESKLFLQIINKPVVEYLVEELAASGIKEIVIVSNHTSMLKKFFNKDKRLTNLLKKLKKDKLIDDFAHIERLAKIDIIEQYEPMGWLHEVLHAREYLKNGPFIVCFSDVLYDSKIPATKQVIQEFNKTNKNIKTFARFLFKPDVFKIIEKEHFELGRDIADLDVMEKLKQRNDLIYMTIKGNIYNVGEPLEYLKTETAFALKDKKIGKDYRKFLKQLIK